MHRIKILVCHIDLDKKFDRYSNKKNKSVMNIHIQPKYSLFNLLNTLGHHIYIMYKNIDMFVQMGMLVY